MSIWFAAPIASTARKLQAITFRKVIRGNGTLTGGSVSEPDGQIQMIYTE